jgi:hypothetical protein
VGSWRQPWAVDLLCRVMDVSERGYRSWRSQPITCWERMDMKAAGSYPGTVSPLKTVPRPSGANPKRPLKVPPIELWRQDEVWVSQLSELIN